MLFTKVNRHLALHMLRRAFFCFFNGDFRIFESYCGLGLYVLGYFLVLHSLKSLTIGHRAQVVSNKVVHGLQAHWLCLYLAELTFVALLFQVTLQIELEAVLAFVKTTLYVIALDLQAHCWVQVATFRSDILLVRGYMLSSSTLLTYLVF